MRVTRAFCDRIEAAEVDGLRRCIDNVQARFPELHAECASIGDGIAAFAGPEMPFSEAMGIGLTGPAAQDEARAVDRFYRERGCEPRVRVTPYTHTAFVRALAALDYVPLDVETAFACDLRALGARRDDRFELMRDAEEWSRATGSAYVDGPCTKRDRDIGFSICTSPEVTALEARVDGVIVASGCMDVQGEIAGFFGAATAPAHRGRGWQSALIADRAARGVERGARFGRATTRLGTVSEQNFRRAGFVVLYTRTTWGTTT